MPLLYVCYTRPFNLDRPTAYQADSYILTIPALQSQSAHLFQVTRIFDKTRGRFKMPALIKLGSIKHKEVTEYIELRADNPNHKNNPSNIDQEEIDELLEIALAPQNNNRNQNHVRLSIFTPDATSPQSQTSNTTHKFSNT
ncbi:MAG: hypothetical protein QNK11_00035 [Legionella sp.]|nr:hypothetical protein [Legionella sp.]